MKGKFKIPKNLIELYGEVRCLAMKEYLERKTQSEYQEHMEEWKRLSENDKRIKHASVATMPNDCLAHIGNYLDYKNDMDGWKKVAEISERTKEFERQMEKVKEITKANASQFETIKAIVRRKHDELHCPMNPKKHWDTKNRMMRKAYAEIGIEIERIER